MHYILLLFALILISCDKGPTEPVVIIEPTTVDTIDGWINAGLQLSGDSTGIEYLLYHEGTDQIICSDISGKIYLGDRKTEAWKQISIGNTTLREYQMMLSGDSVFLVTRFEELWVYDVPKDSWVNLTPPEDTWYNNKNEVKMKCVYKASDGYIYVHFQDYFLNPETNIPEYINGGGTKIFRLNKNQWERVDSGWPHGLTALEFQEVEGILYLLSFEGGLWRFNGENSWEQVPGTVPYEDIPGTPGPKPRSIASHNDNVYVGTIGGSVFKLNPDDSWEEVKYALRGSTMETMDTLPQVYGGAYFLQSFNGILYHTHGQVYRGENDSLWKPITPNNKDTVYLQDHYDKVTTWLYAKCMRQVVIGDTIYNALTDVTGKEHGVYRLDLNQCGWYRDYKKTGILK